MRRGLGSRASCAAARLRSSGYSPSSRPHTARLARWQPIKRISKVSSARHAVRWKGSRPSGQRWRSRWPISTHRWSKRVANLRAAGASCGCCKSGTLSWPRPHQSSRRVRWRSFCWSMRFSRITRFGWIRIIVTASRSSMHRWRLVGSMVRRRAGCRRSFRDESRRAPRRKPPRRATRCSYGRWRNRRAMLGAS